MEQKLKHILSSLTAKDKAALAARFEISIANVNQKLRGDRSADEQFIEEAIKLAAPRIEAKKRIASQLKKLAA